MSGEMTSAGEDLVCAAIFHNDETTQLNTYLLTRQQLISAAFTRWDVGQPIRMFGVSVAQEHHGH
jgi:hypothetical protein